MKALGWLAILWLSAATASAQTDAFSVGRPWPSPPQRPTERPHPAVVRIVTPEKDGVSLGSGSLVAVTGSLGAEKGIVLTNWHVVRDGNGQVTVVFADGVKKAGRVLKVDSDWDLAAIEIDQPHVAPVELADATPRRGEKLSIAGYGPGPYRAASGRCTQFLSPGGGLPFEIVELSVAARQGDSGGPILNERGELAGVLFGAARGTTSGSHCGRVKMFLDAFEAGQPERTDQGDALLAVLEPPRSATGGQWVAARRTRPPERLPVVEDSTPVAPPSAPAFASPVEIDVAVQPVEPVAEPQTVDGTADWLPLVAAEEEVSAVEPASQPAPKIVARSRPRPNRLPPRQELAEVTPDNLANDEQPPLAAMATGDLPANSASMEDYLTWQDLAGHSTADQFKSVLAAIGIVGLFLHGFRCLRIV